MSDPNSSSQVAPAADQPIDLAPLARPRWWTGTQRHDLHVHDLSITPDGLLQAAQDPTTGEWQIGLEWREPRDVRRVTVRFARPDAVPRDLRLQYWRHNWPNQAPERRPGARRGWIGRDDPWHGRWTTLLGEKLVEGSTCTFTCDPIDVAELGPEASGQLPEAQHYLARFRRSLKIRLVTREGEQPPIAALTVTSGSLWREGLVDVRFGATPSAAGDWSGAAAAYNGTILGVEPLDFQQGDAVLDQGRWQCHVQQQPKGVRLRVLYAEGNSPGDRTVLTIRTQARTFSFLLNDLTHGPIYIPDYGVYVTWAEGMPDLATFLAQPDRPRSLYERVADEPEQSLARAMAEIPPLDVTKQAPRGRYLPLGVEAGRQEYGLRYNGELFADKLAIKLKGRDGARLLWPANLLRFCFGSGDPPTWREDRFSTHQSLEDGWLPIVTSEWLDREIEYRQTAFGALLDGPLTPPAERRGNESTVVMMQIVIRNVTHGAKRACLWLAIAPQEQLELRDGLVLAQGRVVPAEPVARQWRVDRYEDVPLRCAIQTGGRGRLAAVPYTNEVGASYATPTAILYQVDLASGESHTITLAVPFISLTTPEEWAHAASLDYEAKRQQVADYWRNYVESGGQMQLPDAILGDFYKAARAHVAINVDKDPASGLITVPAATWNYPACGNEACWQITMLDQAGHHDRAADYLETFLRTQGMVCPDGRFSSSEGSLQGLDVVGQDADGRPIVEPGLRYNLDHGYIMECLAEHYRLSGDRGWLERVAPHLIAGCEFVIRERQATKSSASGDAPTSGDALTPEWGLLPPGHLEDNQEWRYWFSVNAHAYGGMRAIADVLGEIGNPQAARLAGEAEAYRQDIRRAALRAMEETPVVRLLDGTYVPHIPARADIRGRTWGWFREAAYGALHLLESGVFAPDEPEMTWLLQDLEDNLFVSREWGRPVDLEKYWFSHGGVTIQPNLMDLGIDYLRRGQIAHGLRALFNNYGSLLYPDVRAFAEHPVAELGHGQGPFYKTPDEAKALVWLRAFLLHEEGERLWLAPGAPRAWFADGQTFAIRELASHFGPVSYSITASPDRVVARITAPQRQRPDELLLRVRRPGGGAIQRVLVNGKPHAALNPAQETISLPTDEALLEVEVFYS